MALLELLQRSGLELSFPATPLAVLVFAAALSSRIDAQKPAAFDAAWRDVVKLHEQSVRDAGIVGSSVMFVHGGDVLGKSFVGLADKASGRAVDENTIYHWASITKTFTGIAIMQLRDRGLLTLDDPVIKYVPELAAVHNPFGDMNRITIRQLMSHTAGFRNPTWPWGGDKPWHPYEPTEWSQLVAMMPYTEILFEPGSKYSYSNPGVIFLGRIIEKLSGDNYEVYIDKNILKPLEMYRTYFDITPRHLLQYRSNNYYVQAGVVKENGLDFDTGITVSNGGLNAPLPDMVRYLSFLTGKRDRQEIYNGILKRHSLEEMWQPQIEITAGAGHKESVGLSFFISEADGARYIGHSGEQKAFVSFIAIHPESGAAAIAAFNTIGVAAEGQTPSPDTGAIMAALRATLYKNVFPMFSVQKR
jgi:CubicO group peptidase (beta-lactamase class C family)